MTAFYLARTLMLSFVSVPVLSARLLDPQKHEGQLSVMQLMDMLTGVASGMKYLTEMGFVHKRLAAHKVRTAENDDVGGCTPICPRRFPFECDRPGFCVSSVSISGAGQLQPGLQGVRLQTPSGGQDRGHLHHTGRSSLEILKYMKNNDNVFNNHPMAVINKIIYEVELNQNFST